VSKKEKLKWVTLDRINKEECRYNLLIGQRSNGKTYATLKYGLENYIKNKKQMGIIRRYREDFRGKRSQTLFDSLIADNVISELTDGEYTGVYSYGLKWYLCRFDDELNKRVTDPEPFAYGFPITEMVHDKSTSYPNITTIVFDEFIAPASSGYLADEFVLFCNTLSTIIRQRDDVKIYMLGNTISKYCPYFKEMGLTDIAKMKEGDIQVYQYGEGKNPLKVAVQFTDSVSKKGKASDVYFAFDNPKLKMITGDNGQGVWELDIYPHNTTKYTKKHILLNLFILFNDEVIQGDIVSVENKFFLYFHKKSSDIKDHDRDLIYSLEDDPRHNHRRCLHRGIDSITKKVSYMFTAHKVFYQDNELGEMIQAYIKESEN